MATPTACTGECVIGEWRVAEIGRFIEESFSGAPGVRGLTFKRAEGSFGFRFDHDGTVRIVADDYAVTVDAEVRFVGDVETSVTFDGEITGRYAVAGDVLTLSETNNDAFAITAETPFGGIDVDAGDFFGDGDSAIACTGDTLSLYPEGRDEAAIVLTRAAPPATPAP